MMVIYLSILQPFPQYKTCSSKLLMKCGSMLSQMLSGPKNGQISELKYFCGSYKCVLLEYFLT